ncbi:hypothetical protein QE152_g1748 [Popillia japonica]|uniref:Uncharacterized protein n=1 Tax=Popillia japonica TaxID=7064 RepID=A0AAW1N5T7_POPJA
MINNPGKIITDRNIGHIFGEAYLKAATLEIAIRAWQIRALPKYDQPTSNTRKKQKCSILTSTPVKEQLEQKEKEHGEKERKKQERKEIISSVKRNLQLANEPKKHSKVQKSGSKSNDNIKCPGCSELFEDPPIEAWILYDECNCWWHHTPLRTSSYPTVR